MLTMEANNIQNAMNSPLPLLTFGAIPKVPQGISLPDEWLMEDGFVATSAHTEVSLVEFLNLLWLILLF